MRVALYSGEQKLCVLDGGDVPKEMPRHQAAHEIVDFWLEGHWVWVNGDTKAIRYESITSIEILPETAEVELQEPGVGG